MSTYESIVAYHLVGLSNVWVLKNGINGSAKRLMAAKSDGIRVTLRFADEHEEIVLGWKTLYADLSLMKIGKRSLGLIVKEHVTEEQYSQLDMYSILGVLIDVIRYFGVKYLDWAMCAFEDYVNQTGYPFTEDELNDPSMRVPLSIYDWTYEELQYERQA